MRWPWVGIGRLDDAHAERDYLRAELASAQDHIRRMQRRSEGLPELPKQAKPNEPMPADIREKLDAWENPDIRRRMTAKANVLYAATGSWEQVRASLEPDE